MITLLSMIFGFLSSFIKPLIGYFQDIKDKKHELDMMNLQLQFNQANLNAKIEEIRLEQESADLLTRYIPSQKSEVATLINEATKTIIAIALVSLYCLVNYIYYKELAAINDASFFATQMWTEEDYAFIGVILGYYFGTVVKGSKA